MKFGIRLLAVILSLFFFFMVFFSIFSSGYKTGQIDYQKGIREWILISPTEVYHVEKVTN